MSKKAIIFDIQRASLHDGPGIRTTIFLKGCPLNCLWCHNPEATTAKRQLFFHFDKCTQCGNCAKVCDYDVHHFMDGKHTIDHNKCTQCGKCVETCNFSALKIIGAEMSVYEIIPEIMADFDFFTNSGGGLTLSGGEPLHQFSFSKELLIQCRRMGVHTCIETSGCVSANRFMQILPYVDMLLFDYKLTGSNDYKKYTGVTNEQILENLNLACSFGVPVILRCTIIPGINDTDEHFKGICELNKKYPDLKGIEILPYHTMGNSKRISIGFDETLDGLSSVPSEISAKWIEKLKELGCNKAKIG